MTTVPPIARPYAYSYRPLGECEMRDQFLELLGPIWGDEVNWGRVTRIDQGHPIAGYSHGWYYEGWRCPPAQMDPPHRKGPFSYPVQSSPAGPL